MDIVERVIKRLDDEIIKDAGALEKTPNHRFVKGHRLGLLFAESVIREEAKRNGCGNVDGRGFGTAPKTQGVIAVSNRFDAKSSVMGSERSTPQKLSVNSKLLETKRKIENEDG